MQKIIVDMTPGFRQPTIHYSQGDVGTTFAIDIRSRFGDTLPASPTVKIQATKPSGFGFKITADSVTDSVATFTTVTEMTDEAGRFQAELEVSKDGVVLYTANFYMEGEINTHPEGTTDGSAGTVIPTLTLLVERVETAASSILDMTVEAETLAAGSQATYSYDEATNTATFGIPQGEAGAGAADVTASAYSSSKTYAVGDYVIHNSNLYRCTTAITTAEAFTAAHWTQVVLADDVTDLKSALTKTNRLILFNEYVLDGTESFIQNNQADGEVCNLSPTAYANYGYVIFQNIPKDTVFTITGTTQGANRARLWSWLDTTNHIISKADVIQSEIVTVDVTCPTEGATLVINVYTSKAYNITVKNLPTDVIQSEINDINAEQDYQNTAIKKNQDANNIIFPRFESGMVTVNNTDGFVYSNNSNRIRLIEGETIHLYAGDKVGLTDYTDLRIYLCRFDTTTQTYKTTDWRTKDLTVYPDGEGDYSFAISYQTDRAITNIYAVASKFFIQRTNNPVRLKVLSYNIGHFAYGGGSQSGGIYERYGIPTEVYDDRLKNWKNFFSNASTDIAFIQEYSRCLDRVTGASDETGSVSTLENLFQYLYPYNIVRRNPNGAFIDNCLFSTYQLIDYKLIPLGSVENQSRVWADYAKIAIGNRTITLVNVHLYAGENNIAKRAENISDLIDAIAGEKYVIICGDMNIYSASELQPLVDAGYTINNTGAFYGNVATYNTNVSYLSNNDETAGQGWTDSAVAAGTSLYLDNIITTQNILVQSFEAQYDWYAKLTSDHVAVIANIIIV